MSDTSPVIKVTKLDAYIFSNKFWVARIEAKKWAENNIQGKSPINKATGWKIDITSIGVRKAISGERLTPHFEAIRAIPELIENAVLTETRPDRNRNPDIKNIHIFYAPLEVDGNLYRAKLTVRESIYGKKYYDHSLTELEKPTAGRALRRDDTFTGSASPTEQQAYTISLGDLLKNVKTSD
ncbi:hypothetical protein [Candidatus Magnetominusculus xianensis]|uniref:Large polyvalent protein-associated domain-containing protein n=1 Tax=Candidatus Magnetominusculus xianensis TaxID=1748249 RepID=A0ABR5SFE8_9BACT|nr:hypothetical protein [Candidatus Magnetominusculus xianensis]KWT83689.1 hypothetical protein ASN18_2140 [Candidatus Magnetominusculus xianensis]MBF0402613.1 hypothetical protein [Nitrospirota bacterium]